MEMKLILAHNYYLYRICYTTLKLFYYYLFSMIGYTSHYRNQLSHGLKLVLEHVNISFFLSLIERKFLMPLASNEIQVTGQSGLPLTPARRILLVLFQTAVPYAAERTR